MIKSWEYHFRLASGVVWIQGAHKIEELGNTSRNVNLRNHDQYRGNFLLEIQHKAIILTILKNC